MTFASDEMCDDVRRERDEARSEVERLRSLIDDIWNHAAAATQSCVPADVRPQFFHEIREMARPGGSPGMTMTWDRLNAMEAERDEYEAALGRAADTAVRLTTERDEALAEAKRIATHHEAYAKQLRALLRGAGLDDAEPMETIATLLDVQQRLDAVVKDVRGYAKVFDLDQCDPAGRLNAIANRAEGIVGPDPKLWCQKGACTRAATRIAHLTSEGRIVARILACDEHGGPPFLPCLSGSHPRSKDGAR